MKASEIAALRAALLDWYDVNARSLPWRTEPGEATRTDPYRVWMSEVMLQQTTTVHAAPYFHAFTERWPTVSDLAAAEDADVMAAWAGLGYYARARNLLACARMVAQDYDGVFPDTEEALLKLKGVGAYTAAAVAAIAFGRPANVVDGNVERVMSRLFAVKQEVPAARPELKRLAGMFVSDHRPSDWPQALMDLGARVCRPKSPLCEQCPLSFGCVAFKEGEPQTYPRKAKKTERPHRLGHAFALRDGKGRVALVKRPDNGLLGGMLGLIGSDWSTAPAYAPPFEGDWFEAGTINHVFTHFSLDLTAHVATGTSDDPAVIWMDEAEALASLPTVFRKALERALAA